MEEGDTMTALSHFRHVSRSRSFATAVLCLLYASIPAGAADIEVTGLPSGLTVGVRIETGACVAGGGRNSVTGINLSERVIRRFEPITVGSTPVMRLVEGSTYVGERIVNMPGVAANQCPPDQQFRAIVAVQGRRAGSNIDRFRETIGGSATWAGETVTSRRLRFLTELQARTTPLTDSDANAPPGPTLNRDVEVNWAASFLNPFGAASVVEPKLEFFTIGLAGVQRGSPGSFSTLLFRIITAGNNACLIAGNNQNCGPVNQAISLSAGNVTVTRVTVGAVGTNRSHAWRFRLAPQFPTGQFEVVARARDQAPSIGGRFLYRVADRPPIIGPSAGNKPTIDFRDLQLLPWEEFSRVVTVQ
jgi:hypothetical protein